MRICIIDDCNNKHFAKGYCNKHYKKQYYQNNKEFFLQKAKEYGKVNSKKLVEKRRSQKAEYYLKNKERILKVNKEYRENNKDKEKQRHQRWGKENREKRRAAWRRREASRRGNMVEKYSESEVLTKYGTRCYLCLKPINLSAPRKCGLPGWEKGLHIEHVIDIAKGGPDTLENVRPSHAICNLTKKPREMV